MIYFPNTHVMTAVSRDVTPGNKITAEGAALVYDTDVAGTVRLSTSSTERFAGISIDAVTPVTTVPMIEDVTSGAGGLIVLKNPPVLGTMRVTRSDTNVTLTAGATADATHYKISSTNPNGIEVTEPNMPVTVAYTYSPTAYQLPSIQGDITPGGPAGQYIGAISVITHGDVFTDRYDTSGDWSSAVGVTIGANGLFFPVTVGGLNNVAIIKKPNSSSAYLGLTLI